MPYFVMMNRSEELIRACEIVGSQSALAKMIGIKPPSLRQWIIFKRPIPVGRCVQISQATGWRITPHDLRPDTFRNPWDGLPEDMARELLCDIE